MTPTPQVPRHEARPARTPSRRVRPQGGFTLIELLIVVAIIAILAAIAVPNFLEAQVRSKISRELSDMRSIATAIESYCVDHNDYPPHAEILSTGVWNYPALRAGLTTVEYVPWLAITTPVAYMSARVDDVFRLDDPDERRRTYGYIHSGLMRNIMIGRNIPALAAAAEQILPTFGSWRIYAGGPDGDMGPDAKTSIPYDPTNGTTSNGDIMRSQRRPMELQAAD